MWLKSKPQLCSSFSFAAAFFRLWIITFSMLWIRLHWQWRRSSAFLMLTSMNKLCWFVICLQVNRNLHEYVFKTDLLTDICYHRKKSDYLHLHVFGTNVLHYLLVTFIQLYQLCLPMLCACVPLQSLITLVCRPYFQ